VHLVFEKTESLGVTFEIGNSLMTMGKEEAFLMAMDLLRSGRGKAETIQNLVSEGISKELAEKTYFDAAEEFSVDANESARSDMALKKAESSMAKAAALLAATLAGLTAVVLTFSRIADANSSYWIPCIHLLGWAIGLYGAFGLLRSIVR